MEISKLWDKMSPLPLGKKGFSMLLRRFVPYTGSIPVEVIELRPGYGKLQIPDKKSVRNHLNSIHAIALANLGEVSCGLPLMYTVEKTHRAILSKLEITYLKKARGTLTAEASFDLSLLKNPALKEIQITSQTKDTSGVIVSTTTTLWNVKPL